MLKGMKTSEIQQWIRSILGQSAEEIQQTKESLVEQEQTATGEKKELFGFLLRIVGDVASELAKDQDGTGAAQKGLFPEITDELTKQVMAAIKKDTNLAYQLGAKQTMVFDRVASCVGDGAVDDA